MDVHRDVDTGSIPGRKNEKRKVCLFSSIVNLLSHLIGGVMTIYQIQGVKMPMTVLIVRLAVYLLLVFSVIIRRGRPHPKFANLTSKTPLRKWGFLI